MLCKISGFEAHSSRGLSQFKWPLFLSKLVVEPPHSSFSKHEKFSSFPKQVNSISCAVIYDFKKPSSTALWHSRLGHAHFPAIGFALKYCNIHVSNKSYIIF